MTRCLPLDDRLTRNMLEETIASDVDSLEESEYAAIVLISSVVVLVVSTIVAQCLKKSSGARLVNTRNPGLLMRRNTLHSDTFQNLR